MDRKIIHRDGDWIKSHWTDLRKILNDVFESYNRLGQHDHRTVAWYSDGKRERWRRNAESTNENVCFPSVIEYSIALLEKADLQAMGRKMPEGTGIDDSIPGNRSRGSASGVKRRSYKKRTETVVPTENGLIQVLNNGVKNEKKKMKSDTILQALQILLSKGSNLDKKGLLRNCGSWPLILILEVMNRVPKKGI